MMARLHRLATAFTLMAMGMVAMVSAQESDSVALPTSDGYYRVELHMIGGFGGTFYPEPPSRYSGRSAFVGYNVNARLMWHPDHLLSVGLMSGYQVFSHEKFPADSHPELSSDIVMELSSIPIHVVFEVRPLDIRFGAGIGAYLLLSQLHENGGITDSWDVAYGGSAWVGYTFPITNRLRIGPDVALQVVSDRGIVNLSAMFTLQYDIVVY